MGWDGTLKFLKVSHPMGQKFFEDRPIPRGIGNF
jgi:hypothetical protein